MKRSKGRSRPYRLSLLLVPLALLAALLVLPGPAYAGEARAPDTALTAPTAQSPPLRRQPLRPIRRLRRQLQRQTPSPPCRVRQRPRPPVKRPTRSRLP